VPAEGSPFSIYIPVLNLFRGLIVRLDLIRLVRPAGLALVASACALVLAAAPVPASVASAASAPHPADIGPDWVQQSLPSGYSIGVPLPGNPKAPVSCVSGTTFCAVVANDDASSPSGQNFDNEAVFVTSDGSKWTTTGDLADGYQYSGISCPSVMICYVAGVGTSEPGSIVEVTTDGGQTWNPTAGSAGSGLINSIDCPTSAICYLASGFGDEGAIIYTLDSGTTWHNGYVSTQVGIDSITCGSAPPDGFPCVAVGGSDNANIGQALVLVGAGAGWTQSTSPVLSEISTLFGISCVPNGTDPETCYAAGMSNNQAGSQSAPVELVSSDGGQTWAATGFTAAGNGWLNSISCADTTDCWAASTGTELALAGTDDGSTWYPETVGITNQDNEVSCASVDFCVATADNALWTTTDDGGITTAPTPDPPISRPLPPITPPTVTATAGKSETVTDQDRQADTGTVVAASVRLPDGHLARTTARIGRFFFYSLRVASLPIGTVHVRFALAGQTLDYVTIHSAQNGSSTPARFTSGKRATFAAGKRSKFDVKVAGSPHPWLWEAGKLPKGISFKSANGQLSGTPGRSSAGIYRLTFTASNGAGPDAVQHFVLTIDKNHG
jgi:photosystem II stability/assembly factor-like uncharacterized protein